jgi:uncharacterized protein YhbP (UPF0306 family)
MRVAARRIAELARDLLDASTLCAIATVSPGGKAYVNTAYFAWSPELDVVWLSDPGARHSRNVRANGSVAIAVYDSSQTWGKPDRGIQLFGTADEADDDAEAIYAGRFPEYEPEEFAAYRLYRFRPRRIKVFDERELGPAMFVSARVAARGRVVWDRTEVYRAGR